MRVLRHWPPQAPRSHWIFVCTEIYLRVAPIWVSDLPWMEDFVFFTFVLHLYLSRKAAEEMGSQKAAVMGAGEEAQQRRQSRKLRRVQPRNSSSLRGATAPTGGSATRRESATVFRQRISGRDSACTSQQQPHHSGLSQGRQHAHRTRFSEPSWVPPSSRRHSRPPPLPPPPHSQLDDSQLEGGQQCQHENSS